MPTLSRCHVFDLRILLDFSFRELRLRRPRLPPFFQRLRAIPRLQLPAHAGNLILTRQEDEDPAGREPRMDFASLLDRLRDVVGRCAPAEVHGDGMLARGNVDDRRGRREESLVLGEVRDAEGRRHDDEAQRLR